MVTQAQLLSRTLSQSVRARQQQEAQRQAEAQRKSQLESQRKAQVQVAVQPSAEQQAYTTLNQIVSKAIGRGQKSLKGSDIENVKDAFRSAGLDPNLGVNLYKKGMTAKGTAYASAKAGITGGVYMKGYTFEEGKGYVSVPTPTPSQVYPAGFVGPLRPGETRAEPTPSQVYPAGFVGPLQLGFTRAQPTLSTFDINKVLQPQFQTQAQQQFYQQTVVAPRERVKVEQQRYQDLGYTMQESKSLARESIARGGVSFTPETAKRIIFKSSLTPTGEKVYSAAQKFLDMPAFGVGPVGVGPSWRELSGAVVKTGKEVITKFAESPKVSRILDAPLKETALLDLGLFGTGAIDTKDVTVGEFISAPSKGFKFAVGATGEMSEDVYGMIPEEYRPSKIIPGKEEEYKEVVELYKAGEITAEEANRRGRELTIEITPEQIGKGVETVVGFGGYAVASLVPGALPVLLISDIAAAKDDYKNASKLAKKEAEKTYKEYLKEPIEEGYEQISKEEYMKTIVPQFETEIKNQALMAMGTSGAFLVGGALWKVSKALSKFVPRKRFTFGGRKMSQVKYDKLMKNIEKSKISLAKQEKDIFKIRGERELLVPQTTFGFGGKGVSREVVGSAGKIEVSSFADDLFKNFKIFKTKKDAINFVEGMNKIKTKSAAGFPEKLDLMVGKLGDIKKTIKLPKVGKEWITTGDSYSLSSSWRIRGVDKTITFNYQLGSQGRPINVGLQITTVPPKSNYAEIMFYKAGKKGAYNIKDRLIVDVGKMNIIKEGDDVWRAYQPKFRKINFDKRRLSQYEIIDDLVNVPSKTELKTLFDTGKKVERQAVVEKLTLSGYDINIRSVITDKQALGAVTFGKKYDVKILGAGRKEAELFKIPGILEGPTTIIKKTPFDVTFGVDKGISPLTLKQVKVLELPTPTLIISPPKIKPPRVSISKVIQPPPISIETPLMVGGLGLKEVPYAGLGLYERTEPEPFFGELLAITKDGIIEPAKVETKPDVFLIETPSVYLGVGPKIISGLKPLVDIREITKLKTELRTITTPTFAPALIPKVREIVKVRQVPVLRSKLLTKQKVVQQLVTPTIVTPMIVPRPRPRPKPKKPEIIIPFPLLEVPSMKRFPRLKKPTPEVGYGIEIKRKGKWERAKIPYAFATEEGAHAVAMEKVTKEAAASYRLVKSLKPVKRTLKRPTALHKVMFRPGKEKGVIVQKKLLRITTPGEVRQISLKGAAVRRGVSTWGLGKKKKVVKKKKTKKSKSKKKGGKK